MRSNPIKMYGVVAVAAIAVVTVAIYLLVKFNSDDRVVLWELDNEPRYVVNLSKHLQAMPPSCSRVHFSQRLTKIGMNSDPDGNKESTFYWNLTAESYDKPGYVLEAEFTSGERLDDMILQSATINLVKTPGGPWHPIWRIVY